MNRKFIDILFSLILISAPFKLVNHCLWLPDFFAAPFAKDFVIWPLLTGIVYTLYCQWKYGNVFYGWRRFKIFIITYSVILTISLLQGLVIYPYWDWAFNGQALNNAKFALVIDFLGRLGIHIGQDEMLPFWILLSNSKRILFTAFYTFGGAYMIFCWYHDRMNRAVSLLKNVTVGFLVVVAAYGLVDMCYQNGQWWAQNFIAFMWPILHSNTDTSHYPMFFGARNRSLFLEASYYAIYMAFAFPILWWKLTESKGMMRIGLAALYFILAYEIYLGQSRTATALFWGELLLMAFVTLYKRKKKLVVLTLCLMAGATVSFGGAVCFLQYYQVPASLNDRTPLATKKAKMLMTQESDKEITEHVEAYIDDSFGSLFDEEKAKKRSGSNRVRLGVTMENIKLGLKYPIFGVGTGLDTAYMYDVFKEEKNRELKNDFIKRVDEKGLLNKGSPMMCEYSSRFMQGGLLGLAVFIFPMGYIVWCFLRRLLRRIDDEREFCDILFIALADIGISVAGFGNTVNITYCFWLMLGISYVVELALRNRERF